MLARSANTEPDGFGSLPPFVDMSKITFQRLHAGPDVRSNVLRKDTILLH